MKRHGIRRESHREELTRSAGSPAARTFHFTQLSSSATLMSRVRRIKKEPLILVAVALLIVARICLPFVVKQYVNKTLGNLKGYRGHVENIRIHLWRGAYEIIGTKIVKVGGQTPVPFFSVESVDLSIQYKELLHGSLVGEMRLLQPRLNFIKGQTPAQSQTSIDESWLDRVSELFPLDINHVEIIDGAIHFRNTGAEPPVDVHLDRLHVEAQNLSNSRKKYQTLLAEVKAEGRPMENGFFTLSIAFNPFAARPLFQLQSTVSHLDVTTLNAFLKHYGGVLTTSGTLNIYAECAAKGGAFNGYVKPFIRNLHFAGPGHRELTFFQKVKGVIGNIAAVFFKNRRHDTDASKLEFSGNFDDAQIHTWTAIRYAFHHAFIHALKPALDHTVSLANVKPK